MSVSLSFRTREEMRQQLDKIAAILDRNRNWVINEAIANFVDLHAWQAEEIRQGVADSENGRTLSTEELRKRLSGKSTSKPKKRQR